MCKYIYSPSYPSVRLIQYFVNKGEKVKVITANASIKSLCNHMKWDVIWFDAEKVQQIVKRNVLNPAAWFRHYKILNGIVKKTISQINDGELYLTTLGIDIIGLHLIQKIAGTHNNIQIKYWAEVKTPLTLHQSFPASLREFVTLIRFNILFSPRYTFREDVSGKYLFVTNDYLVRNNISILQGDEIWKTDVYGSMKLPELGQKSISLILGGYSLKQDEVIFEGGLRRIYELIYSVLPDCRYKPHPGEYKIDGILKKLTLFEYAELPCEFLHYHLNVVICVVSSGVSYLVKKNVKVISVIDLVGKDDEKRKELKRTLVAACEGEIIFPKNEQELKSLLKDIKKVVK